MEQWCLHMQCHRLIRIQIANDIYQVMAVGTAVNLMPGVVTMNVGSELHIPDHVPIQVLDESCAPNILAPRIIAK